MIICHDLRNLPHLFDLSHSFSPEVIEGKKQKHEKRKDKGKKKEKCKSNVILILCKLLGNAISGQL